MLESVPIAICIWRNWAMLYILVESTLIYIHYDNYCETIYTMIVIK